MELNITRFFTEADAFEFSASRAERGQNAGPETWSNAKDEAASSPLLTTEEELADFRDYTRGYGAWEDEEIDAWTPTECNALLIQMISGDMREAGLDNDPDEADWAQYEKDCEAGRVASNIFRSGDQIYYYVGN